MAAQDCIRGTRCFVLWCVALLAGAVQAQGVVPDPEPAQILNPADRVPYTAGAGRSCSQSLADTAARTVLGIVERCPLEVVESRRAYYAYIRQAVIGLLVPGASEAAGLLALDKARENALFCISGALIEATAANPDDRAFLTALVKEAKEINDRVEMAGKLVELGVEIRKRGLDAFVDDGELNSFVNTLDVQIRERQEGVGIRQRPDGTPDPDARSVEIELVNAGRARHDTAGARARAASERAHALALECDYPAAELALTEAINAHLAVLVDLRAEVESAKHRSYCLERNARLQRFSPMDAPSPFLRNALAAAEAEIREAQGRDAEQTALIGRLAEEQSLLQRRRNDVALLETRTRARIQTARDAIARCEWDAAQRALEPVTLETLDCALPLDAVRRERDEQLQAVDAGQRRLLALDEEYARVLALPLASVGSCGEFSVFADGIDQLNGRCRTLAAVDDRIAELRQRAKVCAEFKTAATQAGDLLGTVTVSPVKFEDHGGGSFTRSTYGETQHRWERVDRNYPYQVTIDWQYAGIPSSLVRGQRVTITVTGGVSAESPAGAGDGMVLAGAVSVSGDVRMEVQQQADRGHAVGTYAFVVNPDARRVEIHLGGAPMGTGAIWTFSRPN